MPPGEQHSSLFSANVDIYNGDFVNKRNQNIHCYYWKTSEKPRALLIISHGFTEHSMMYDSLATEMAKRGFFVFSHDHVGHGKSDGTRAFMNDMHDLVEDTLMHIKFVRKDYPDLPLFMCGHSLGGAVSLKTVLHKEIPLDGIVLIAPALKPNPETAGPWKIAATKLLSKYLPHFPIAFTDFSLACQNAQKVSQMDADPLMFHGYWKVRPVNCLLQSGEEILRNCSDVKTPFLLLHGTMDKVCHVSGATELFENTYPVNEHIEILRNCSDVKTPFLLLHGTMDKVCHVSGATELFENTSTEDKSLKLYPNGYHCLLHEPDEIANDVFHRTVQWLDSRVQ
ncbi:monoglyceride lipase-like [Uloborus diversus]|uniref:monoglyceride lipase-like n=1 Tax=Uloborus diversus TaxID=327109 RepID=UPI00240A863A|nr:monoglyceride lipase-like [Uloborus diversus]